MIFYVYMYVCTSLHHELYNSEIVSLNKLISDVFQTNTDAFPYIRYRSQVTLRVLARVPQVEVEGPAFPFRVTRNTRKNNCVYSLETTAAPSQVDFSRDNLSLQDG